MSKAQRTRLQAYAWLTINTVCWGGLLVLVKPSLDLASPNFLMFYRFAIAGLIMMPYVLFSLRKKKLRRVVPMIMGIELIGTVISLTLLYQGLSETSAIEASLLASSLPIFIIVASLVLLKEKLTRHEWVGFFISLIGVLLLTVLPLINGQAALQHLSLRGNGLIILSNVVGAIYIILAKKYYKRIPKLYAASISFLLGSMTFALLSLREVHWSLLAMKTTIMFDWQQWVVVSAVLVLAILGSIIGMTSYIKGQDQIEASEASLFYYLQPLIYLPLGVALLHETVSPLQIFSLILILFGVFYSEQPFAKRRK